MGQKPTHSTKTVRDNICSICRLPKILIMSCIQDQATPVKKKKKKGKRSRKQNNKKYATYQPQTSQELVEQYDPGEQILSSVAHADQGSH